MRAVILAGGLGTRLRPYTTVLPKPLVPVGDRPILEHILARLAECGVTRVDLCVSHLGELIQTYFSQAKTVPDGMELRWHWEDEPLGTAGALTVVPDLDEPFIAMNGDVLTDLNYRALMAHHEQSGAALTVATHRKDVQVELGVVEIEDGAIVGYREKPTLHYEVSTGIYAYDPRALAHLPAGEACQFPDLVLRLIAAGESVSAFGFTGTWFDIGTLAEYERASEEIASGVEVSP